MANVAFYWNNLWEDYTLSYSTQHVNFPAANSQHQDFRKPWRSRHGADSGWGRFYIYATSQKLDFKVDTTTYVATITIGAYSADTLATEIEAQMQTAAATCDFIVEYLDNSNKFKITLFSGGTTFQLLWNTGANKANSIAFTIGFDDSADDTGSLAYTADYIRINTEEYLTIDLGSAKAITGCHIRGQNFQSAATVKLQASTNDFSSVAWEQSFTIQADILTIQLSSAQTYRYWRIKITGDIDNPDLYLEMGYVFLGDRLQPTRQALEGISQPWYDPSQISQSEAGQETAIVYDKYFSKDYNLQLMSAAEKTNFETMFKDAGYSGGWFFCENPDSPLTKTWYVKFTKFLLNSIKTANNYWALAISIEEKR